MTQIIVTLNGPGEIAGWFAPVSRVLRARFPHVRIIVALLPCNFASRAELGLLRSSPLVDAACSVRETLALISRGRQPPGLRAEESTALLHLGGDPAWSWLLAKRLGVPAYAYAEYPFSLQSLFERVFFAGLNEIPASKRGSNSELIGDLVVDAAWTNAPGRERHDPQSREVALYPGSRDYMVKYMLPFLANAVDIVAEQMPDLRWKLAKAEFLPQDFLRQLPDVNDGRQLAGQNLKWCPPVGGDPESLMTVRGNRIEVTDHVRASAGAALAITIPGTTTAELAALGVPMLVVLPLVHYEKVPLPGPLNYIDAIPVVGKYLKRLVGRIHLHGLKFSAHPNRRAKRMIVPELIGRLEPDDVARETIRLMNSPIEQLGTELKAVMGHRGAAEKLVSAISVHLERRAVHSVRHQLSPDGSPRPDAADRAVGRHP